MHFLDIILIVIRYTTIILCIINFLINNSSVHLDPRLYKGFGIIEALSNPIIISAADCILAIRIWALYQQNKPLLGFLLFLIVIQTGCLIIFLGSPYPFSIVALLPNVLTAAIMFCLSSGKCIQSIRRGNSRKMPVMTMFLHDGVWWFFWALVILIVEIAEMSFFAHSFHMSGLSVSVAYSIVASHVVMGMRALERKWDEEVQPSHQLTTLAFQSEAQAEESIVSRY